MMDLDAFNDPSFRTLQNTKINRVPDSVSPSQLIVSTFRIYGSTFLCCFALFLFLRSKFPLTYTYNSRVINQMTPLSKHRFGIVRWMSKIFKHSDEEIFQHCGMAAIVYLRFLRLGIKLACVGIFNSFFLIPVNLNGCDEGQGSAAEECLSLVDQVEKLSFGHLTHGSMSAWATTVAAYVIFGSAMYFIYEEFQWYIEYRHKFCIQPRPDNYTVYIAHIPEEYRSDEKLKHYFQTIFQGIEKDAVLEARVAMDLKSLESKVLSRKKVTEKLEHAINIRNVKGYEPMRNGNPLTGGGFQQIPSIAAYASELNDLNQEITTDIERIDMLRKTDTADPTDRSEPLGRADTITTDSSNDVENTSLLGDNGNGDDDGGGDEAEEMEEEEKSMLGQLGSNPFGRMMSTVDVVGRTMKDTVDVVGRTVGDTVTTSVTLAKTLIGASEDGAVRDAGFVTFSTLLAKNQCQQIIHHSTPFSFYSMAAPRPEDIVWDNVGIPHKQQQISHLLAQVATIGTCLFWTIPVSFFSSLSELENLKKLIPGLEEVLAKNTWLARFVANLSPLMLVILTSLLPFILTIICKKEGHVGSAELNASLLTKLASFMIVQIFFVQALSGSVTSALQDMIDDWKSIVDLMATTIPVQVKSFIQYVQVKNFLGCSIELLRVTRVAMAFLRHRIGPNLTDKERSTPWMGILPIVEPETVEYPMLFADTILYFMINLVYSCIAPIMSYIMLICLGILSLVFRHQLIYTYSKANDDGGKLWSSAIMLLITCMIISEVTLIGIMMLKKAYIAGTALAPLIAGSFLFVSYIKQQHFRVTEYVPSTLCVKTDKNNHGKLDLSFLKDQYLQSALKEKVQYPDNMERSEVEGYSSRESSEQGSGAVSFEA